MGAILTKVGVCLSDVPKERIVTTKNGKKYVYLDVWINDEKDQYGRNGGLSISQTKEDREAGVKKQWVGNVECKFAKDGFNAQGATAKVEEPQPVTVEEPDDDLPF